MGTRYLPHLRVRAPVVRNNYVRAHGPAEAGVDVQSGAGMDSAWPLYPIPGSYERGQNCNAGRQRGGFPSGTGLRNSGFQRSDSGSFLSTD